MALIYFALSFLHHKNNASTDFPQNQAAALTYTYI